MARKYLTRSRLSPVSRQLVRRLVTVMGAWFDSMNLGQTDAVRKLKRDRYTQARDALERRILKLEEAGSKPRFQLWYVSVVWQLEKKRRYHNCDRYVVMAESEESAMARVRIRIQEDWEATRRTGRRVQDIFQEHCQRVEGAVAYRDFFQVRKGNYS